MTKDKVKIGFLPIACTRFKGMGSDTPSRYEERIQKRLDDLYLKASEFADIVNPGQIYTREDINNAIDNFYREKVDCVFAFFLSWSEDFAWIRFLRDMYPIPILFAHVIPAINYTNTEEEDPFIEYLSTGALVGALEGSGSFKRFDRPMSCSICGRPEAVIKALQSFSNACRVRTILQNSTFGLLNNYNEVMWSTYIDPYLFFMKAGPEIRFISVSELEDAAAHVSDDRVECTINKLMSEYESRNDVEMDHFRASVRCSLAMEDVGRNEHVDMMVLNDVGADLYKIMGLRPGFYPTPENKGEIMAVPEGDLGVGLAVYILGKLTGCHVNIIEPAHIEDDDSLMVVHAGPNDYTDSNGKTIIARDIRFAKSKWKHAGAPFAWHVISPGEKTFLHISQTEDGNLKMVAFTGQAVDHEHTLASYTHGKIVFPGKKIEDIISALLQEGVTQHYAICPGNHLGELQYLARIMGFKYVEI